MYQNMQMPLDKTVSVPPVFRETIVRQLQEEMSRCGGIGKTPAEVEQYIYDTIHSKEEYLEKVGKMILALQQKQQQQQQMPQQGMPAGGQVQYGVRQFQPQVQGQYVQYQQHPQPGQQPSAVLIHTGQGQVGPPQIIRQQAFRQLPPDHIVTMQQGQAQQFRPAPRPGVMPAQQQQQQQMVSHAPMISQQPRQQFPPGQAVLMAQQQPQQPNMVMNQASNIVIGSKVQQAAQQTAQQQRRPPPQQQVRPTTDQQQKFFQQQQQQFQAQQQVQFQQQQVPPPQMQQPPFQPTPQTQQLAALQQQQFVQMPGQQPQPQQTQQTPLPRSSRSFNTGIASPAVAVAPPPTGPSPLGPKGGPGSVGPSAAMSPAMAPMQMAQQIPTPQQVMPVAVPPPIAEATPQEAQFTEMKPSMAQQQQQDQSQRQQQAPPNVTAQSQSSTPEEIAEKLKQLAKYKEPLRMLIETYEGHKDNSSTMNKMKRILDIISGQGCDSMAILRKCEEACIQVVARYCPEPSVNQIFSNALSKVAVAAENIAAQQPNVAKNASAAFSLIASKAFGSVQLDSASIEVADLGDEWNERLQTINRTVPFESPETAAPIFRQFAHLSRAAQRELLFLSEKYAISCRPSSAGGTDVPSEGGADMDDLVAVDFVPTLRCLTDAGAPSICMLISPDYPESPDVPQIVFSPASELNNRLAAIKRKFTQMYDSIKVASVSDVSIIRLITFFEASVLCESS